MTGQTGLALVLCAATLSVEHAHVALASPSPAARVVYLQPLGTPRPTDEDLREIESAIIGMYGVVVRRLPAIALPDSAYYPPRRRYRAEKLISFLAGRLPADGFRVIGVTGTDISTTKDQYPDWGVMGLADIGGRAAVISSFRCRRGARDAAQARDRLAKVAVHELGHTLGLQHCPSDGCIMEDARGKAATSDAETDLCARCRGLLEKSGFHLPSRPTLPWPAGGINRAAPEH